MKVRIERRRLLVLAVGVAMVVVGAVLMWSGESDVPPPAATPARTKPTLKPLHLADHPLWTSKGAVELPASDVKVVNGTTLIFQGGVRVTSVDTATGKVRWTLDNGHDLTGHGGLWSGGASDVLASDAGLLTRWQHTADCTHPPGSPNGHEVCQDSAADQAGLALVSAADGRTVWQKTIIPSYPAKVNYDTRPELLLEVATDQVALVSIGAGVDAFHHDKPPTNTMAIDLRTGATLWENRDGLWPLDVAGDTVLGEVKTTPGPSGQQAVGDWTVAAIDLHTGRQRWSHPAAFTRSRLQQVAGDVALVRGVTDKEPKRTRYFVVEAKSGHEVTDLGLSEHVTSCVDDDETLIACTWQDDKTLNDSITFFRVDKRTVTTVPLDLPDVSLVAAWQGRAELSAATDDAERRDFSMDGSGNVIDRNVHLPGRLVQLTDDRAVFMTTDGYVEVYQVVR